VWDGVRAKRSIGEDQANRLASVVKVAADLFT